jgi:hypothetical protein
MLGSFMAQWALVAIPDMFLLAFGIILLLSRRTIGTVALIICLSLTEVLEAVTKDLLVQSTSVALYHRLSCCLWIVLMF